MIALEHKTMKRKRTQKTAFDKSSQYPLSFQLSSLIYKQSPASLALSSQSVLVTTSTRPHPHQTGTITGDIYHLEAPIRKKLIKQVEDYHKQHTITHLEWNPKGTVLASIDEMGHLALWQMKTSVHDWHIVYKEDLKQPIVAFLWFQSDRKYSLAGQHVKREAFHGPRNPYGPLSFLTLTVHGIVTVHFQQSATRFSQFTTSLPTTQRRKMKEAGCYSMTLAGLDSWERISHASVLLKDNHIYLATYNQTSVTVYILDVQFPKRQDQGRTACRMLSSMEPRPREGYHLTQLVLLPSLSLVICMSSHASHSDLAFWTCQTQQTSVTSALGTVERQETTFVHQSTLEIQDRFISVIKTTQTGQLVIGLSDGSIYQQQTNDLDQLLTTPALVQPSEDPVVDLVLSPNQTHLIYQLNSMKLGVVQIPISLTNEQLEQQFQLCLLNQHDYLDLVAHLIHTRSEDQIDTLVHRILLSYQQHIPFDLAEWSLAQRGKPYGLAMAIYKRIPSRQIQFTHFSRAIQLPLILECFVSSLSDTDKPEFDVHSLWSLVPLSSWVYDYLQWILREWYLLFHRVPLKLTSKQVHAILLVHPESRSCLVKILKCIQQFIQFSQTSNLIPVDAKSLLQRYTTAFVHHEAIVLSETIEFLQALDAISLNEDPWSLLIYFNLRKEEVSAIQAISNQYKHKCAKPWVYIQQTDLSPFDVICKRRIDSQNTFHCMRCQQHTVSLEQEDPCASVQWYQSLKGYHCICGGLSV